ncbi:hypothetical protein GCM10010253_38810 [Streptomyces badius]|uniref:Transposase n=1 Tax=Streptomyces badius TaxID=1941 RepID=A0ABQ2TCZ5_STRBA|nr:hypothetical protein GCM10010253_38810 [Streptomyces badius]
MARPELWDVDEERWVALGPLVPGVERWTRYPGRKRHPDRLVFQSILFVLRAGVG